MSIPEGKYLVVSFNYSKEVKVVPKSWVFEENSKLFSYWPKYPDLEDIYAAARDQDGPNQKTWRKYAIKIYHGFDDYNEAVSEISYFCEHSDFEAKKSKLVQAVPVESEVSSEEEARDPKLLKRDPPVLPNPPNGFGMSFSMRKSPTSNYESVILSDDENPASIPSKFCLTSVDSSKKLARGSQKPRPQISSKQFTTPVSSQKSPLSRRPPLVEIGQGATDLALWEEVNNLKKLVVRNFGILRFDQASIATSVEEMKATLFKLSQCRGALATEKEPEKVDFGFPFRTSQQFEDFNEKVRQDVDFRSEVVKELSLVGGKNLVERVNNGIRKILTDEVCQRYTYFGTAKKKSFEQLETRLVLTDAVRKSSLTASASEVDIKNAIMSFLTHATDRIKTSAGSKRKQRETHQPPTTPD